MKSRYAHLIHHPFKALFNIAFTFCVIGLCVWGLIEFFDWAIFNATWQGSSTQACKEQGACFAMIHARWEQFIYGFYPVSECWRINASFFILAFTLVYTALPRISLTFKIITTLVMGALTLYLLKGGFFLQTIPTNLWGGLFLTIFLTVGSIICAFPLAIILTLGRSSDLIVIKSFCIIFIEIIRGVPLISILFMASVMLPLFVPQEIVIDKLLRAFIGIMCFQAAYMAEVLRAGFNSIPKGQKEAAFALGFSYWQTVMLILLPQALRTVIPGLVNNFIALFKDTTLVLIIGIYDFLGIVQLATTSPSWLGTALEAYLFCGLIYWVFCFSMSLFSKHLEKTSIGSSQHAR